MKNKLQRKSKINSSGHAAHIKDAAMIGLPGKVSRPIKLTLLGAGSAFTPRLINDVFKIPGHMGGVIALVDIDVGRLRAMKRLILMLLVQLGQEKQWKVVASMDRKAVLKDTDYVVNCIEVSGLECVTNDNDIPLKYGVDQCIGDTIGPGGLFKALRTAPVFLDAVRDCEKLCPKALILNYTNPMAMLCTAVGRSSSMPVVGLCHSVQGTSHLLAEYSGVEYGELDWECAGINHLAWFTKLEHRGVDLYKDRLYRKFAADLVAAGEERAAGVTSSDCEDVRGMKGALKRNYKELDLVRKDMCLNFGAFITESSGHLSEYLPYYRKSESGRALLRQGYDGGSRFYATNWPRWRKNADATRRLMLKGEEPVNWERSWEYASWIIEAREKNSPFRIHGNIMNNNGGSGQLITNLPKDSCVEVACMIDGNGIHPTRFGELPRHMANLCSSNLSMFDLGAQAILEGSKEAAIHALMLDPLCSAVCTPSEIRSMALELFEQEKDYLPRYR